MTPDELTEIAPVFVALEGIREARNLLLINVPLVERDLFRAADLEALA